MHALCKAKLDDEPETPGEAAAVEIARQQGSRGQVVAWENVRSHRSKAD